MDGRRGGPTGGRGIFQTGGIGFIIPGMRERLRPRPLKSSPTAAVLLPLLLCVAAHAQAARVPAEGTGGAPLAVTEGSLSELRSKRRFSLVLTRSLLLDTRDPGRALVRQAYHADPRVKRRHYVAFNSIARKLNKYMKKYGGISAAPEVGKAEFLVVFNLLEYKSMLGRSYPYGEMYVVLNQPPGSPNPPRLLWKARKVLWAEDAAGEFIRELKFVRGEK